MLCRQVPLIRVHRLRRNLSDSLIKSDGMTLLFVRVIDTHTVDPRRIPLYDWTTNKLKIIKLMRPRRLHRSAQAISFNRLSDIRVLCCLLKIERNKYEAPLQLCARRLSTSRNDYSLRECMWPWHISKSVFSDQPECFEWGENDAKQVITKHSTYRSSKVHTDNDEIQKTFDRVQQRKLWNWWRH